MVSKLSENGVAGFILANGTLSGGGEEYKIRRKMIENDLVEAIIVLPRDMFYTTDISVTLWILNKSKKARTAKLNGVTKNYRDRSGEILFVDLRRWGSEYEKKFIHLTPEDIEKIAANFHKWQQVDCDKTYKDIPEYCYAAAAEEIKANDYSLVPSKYIEFIDRDGEVDFDKEMKRIQKTFKAVLAEEAESQAELKKAFKGLGDEI